VPVASTDRVGRCPASSMISCARASLFSTSSARLSFDGPRLDRRVSDRSPFWSTARMSGAVSSQPGKGGSVELKEVLLQWHSTPNP